MAIMKRTWPINAPNDKTERAEQPPEGNKGSQGGSAAGKQRDAKNWVFREQFSLLSLRENCSLRSLREQFSLRHLVFEQTHAMLRRPTSAVTGGGRPGRSLATSGDDIPTEPPPAPSAINSLGRERSAARGKKELLTPRLPYDTATTSAPGA